MTQTVKHRQQSDTEGGAAFRNVRVVLQEKDVMCEFLANMASVEKYRREFQTCGPHDLVAVRHVGALPPLLWFPSASKTSKVAVAPSGMGRNTRTPEGAGVLTRPTFPYRTVCRWPLLPHSSGGMYLKRRMSSALLRCFEHSRECPAAGKRVPPEPQDGPLQPREAPLQTETKTLGQDQFLTF